MSTSNRAAICFWTAWPGLRYSTSTGDSTFLLVGDGFQVTFSSTNPGEVFTEILRFVEGEAINETSGKMRIWGTPGGDETRSGQPAAMPASDPIICWKFKLVA